MKSIEETLAEIERRIADEQADIAASMLGDRGDSFAYIDALEDLKQWILEL